MLPRKMLNFGSSKIRFPAFGGNLTLFYYCFEHFYTFYQTFYSAKGRVAAPSAPYIRPCKLYLLSKKKDLAKSFTDYTVTYTVKFAFCYKYFQTKVPIETNFAEEFNFITFHQHQLITNIRFFHRFLSWH